MRLLTLLLLASTSTFGQKFKQEIIHNLTNKKIRLYKTYYYQDTTKTTNFDIIGPEKSTGSSCSFYRYMRLELIAVNDSTGDTIFTQVYSTTELQLNPFVINVTEGIWEPLVTMQPVDRVAVLINEYDPSRNYKVLFKKGNNISIRLLDKHKLNGKIFGFTNDSLFVLDKRKVMHSIPKIQVRDLKMYSYKLIWGPQPYQAVFRYSRYCPVSDIKIVRYFPKTYGNNHIGWDWE